MTQLLDELLASMAPMLNGLRRQLNSEFQYQGTCDGLVWSDEMPSIPLGDRQEQVMCYLIQYRTSLIMEGPIASLELLWNHAMSAFPGWPGFADERCMPSRELAGHVAEARRELDSLLEVDANL